jgi:hypothetical protein
MIAAAHNPGSANLRNPPMGLIGRHALTDLAWPMKIEKFVEVNSIYWLNR